jgi:hypothetical protein
MIIGLAVAMLLALSQSQVDQGTSYRDPLATSSNGQQTAISDDDDSTKTIAHQGRILSRRNTRLNTRITTSKLATIGRSSGASSRNEKNGQGRQRATIP